MALSDSQMHKTKHSVAPTQTMWGAGGCLAVYSSVVKHWRLKPGVPDLIHIKNVFISSQNM